MADWSVEKKKGILLLIGTLVLFVLWLKPDNGKQAEGKQKEEKAEEKVENKAEETIRVLIKNNGYEGIVHKEIAVVFEEQGTKSFDGQVENVTTGQAITFTKENVTGVVTLESGKMKVTSLSRNQGNPVYEEKLEIRNTENGLVLVQETGFENYLKGVLPSEMPVTYEKEALKAQAVCARTYAYGQLREGYAYPEYKAHLDDSVSFQVYMNQQRQEVTDLAVDETKGMILTQKGQPVLAWYFSTSWGQTTDTDAWLSDECSYLEAKKIAETDGNETVTVFNAKTNTGGISIEESFRNQMDVPDGKDFEAEEPWYRWNVTIPVKGNTETLRERLILVRNNNKDRVLIKEKDEYVEGEIKKIGSVKKIAVKERGDGGLVNSLEITTDKQTILVKGQYNIRQVLALPGMKIVKNDGTEREGMQLLPSGFFYIKDTGEGEILSLELKGGGFGHGAGLSQSGANGMAKKGWSYDKILTFFYKDTEVSPLQ